MTEDQSITSLLSISLLRRRPDIFPTEDIPGTPTAPMKSAARR